MYEKLEQCPSCKSAKIGNHTIIKDYSVSKESFATSLCKNCGLLYTNPRPDNQSIWKYYMSDQYISHTNKTHSLKDYIYKIVRSYTRYRKYKLIRSLTKGKAVLDFGAGAGIFVKYLKNKGLMLPV